jgi:hypothetical protein
MRLVACAAVSLCLLTACATPEEIEANRRLQEQEDIATCKSYGLRQGSEAFGNCRLQLDLARQQQRYYYSDPYPRFHYGFYHYR